MSELMPPSILLNTFMVIGLVLAVSPGPGVFYVVTRTLMHGRRSGLATVAGVALGNFVNALAASIGLAALFEVSPSTFGFIKFAGGGYLLYLGFRALYAPMDEEKIEGPGEAAFSRVFKDSFVISLLNPKTAVFFAAFLPQFVGGGMAPVWHGVMLGSFFIAMAAATDTVYVLASGFAKQVLFLARGYRHYGRYLASSAFILLGVFIGLAGYQG